MTRAHAQLPRQQRREEVALVAVDDRDHHVAAADVLGLQQLHVGAVAVQDQGAAQPRGNRLAARGIALDDADVDVGAGIEPLRQQQADVAAADDRHALAGGRLGVVEQRPHVGDGGGQPHHEDLVAGFEPRRAVRDEDAIVAPHRHDQHAARQVHARQGRREQA